jgi:hypothetical protein
VPGHTHCRLRPMPASLLRADQHYRKRALHVSSAASGVQSITDDIGFQMCGLEASNTLMRIYVLVLIFSEPVSHIAAMFFMGGPPHAEHPLKRLLRTCALSQLC